MFYYKLVISKKLLKDQMQLPNGHKKSPVLCQDKTSFKIRIKARMITAQLLCAASSQATAVKYSLTHTTTAQQHQNFVVILSWLGYVVL